MSSGGESFDTIVVGGGQSGLVMGYQLKKLGRDFVILDAHSRVGDSWRKRWDSLRLFTPGWYDGLEGMRFPGPRTTAPSKDAMADYLEAYRERFDLPVRNGVWVSRIARERQRFVVDTSSGRLEADNVVVATGADHHPRTPEFAAELDPRIVQLHSHQYRNTSQLQPGSVLLVGAGNSGADIAMDLAPGRKVWLAGAHPGVIPFDIDGPLSRHLVHVVRFLGHHVLNWGTPVGRRVLPKLQSRGAPVVRVKPKWLAAAGVERVPRVGEVRDGLPVLEDGRVLEPANLIWCTGFRENFSWIDLPVFGAEGSLVHERGVVENVPGLYFVGLGFQYGISSAVISGVSRDARYIAANLSRRERSAVRKPARTPV